MKAALEKAFATVDVELIEGKGGVFEVVHDGQLIFSKKALGRFPEHAEIVNALK